MRELADKLRDQLHSGIVVLAGEKEGKASLLVAVTSDLTKKHRAGDLVKELSKILGGRGGGKPELAQAGGGYSARIDDPLRAVPAHLGGRLAHRVSARRQDSGAARRERVLASPRFKDGRFRNTAKVEPGLKGSPLPLLGEYFFAEAQRTPPGPLPLADPRPAWSRAIDTGLRVTWLGHSSVLLELDGMRVLTDPVFGPRASPISFAGPPAVPSPSLVPTSALPPLDAVLVSHDHYYYLCRETILELCKREVPFITSLGVGGAHLESWGVPASRITRARLVGRARAARRLSELHRGPRAALLRTRRARLQPDALVVVGDPHRQAQGLLLRRHRPHRRVPRHRPAAGPLRCGDVRDWGAGTPSWGDIHLGPQNALKAHALLGSGALFPVHWGTFSLALHAWDEPAETLWRLAEESKTRLLTPQLGAPFEPAKIELPEPWWRALSR